MSLNLNVAQINDLCNWGYLADKEIRTDLMIGMIRDENDYTSNFTGAFRRNINAYSRTGIKATSYLLSSSQERQMGCDATIIISSNGVSKVALFEAKWPRLSDPNYKWDHKQTASGLSHFSDQLDRQKNIYPQFAIFEMFYCEYPFKKQPATMPDEGSSCVWHLDAMKFKNNRRKPDALWSNSDLSNLLKNGFLRIDEILNHICECKVGDSIPIGSIEGVIQEFNLTGNILAIKFSEKKNEKID